jgi:hypothetical protein
MGCAIIVYLLSFLEHFFKNDFGATFGSLGALT